MSKPRVTAEAEVASNEFWRLCSDTPDYRSPALSVRVEFDHGDHESALLRLRSCVAEVERQIAESHAPLWDGPRREGSE